MTPMQSRLDAHPDFKSKIKNKNIALLKAVHNMINGTVITKYTLASITYSLKLIKKKIETEYLLDYVARFKQNCDVMKIYVEKGALCYFEQNSKPYINGKYVLVRKSFKNMLLRN